MPRTPAEKEKAEKRRRLERVMIPVAAVLIIAVYIVLSAVFGKTSFNGKAADETPAPTEEPSLTAARRIAREFSGSLTEGEGGASVAFSSAVDGNDVAVSSYMNDGAVCLQLARRIPIKSGDTPTAAPTPAATQSIFVVDQTERPEDTAAPDATEKPIDAKPYAEEIWQCLSCILPETQNKAGAVSNIEDALKLLLSGDEKKAAAVLGIYVAEFSYSSSDGILRVKCEPV